MTLNQMNCTRHNIIAVAVVGLESRHIQDGLEHWMGMR